jgi:uncharacterized protein YjbJ (UPF0337 family)
VDLRPPGAISQSPIAAGRPAYGLDVLFDWKNVMERCRSTTNIVGALNKIMNNTELEGKRKRAEGAVREEIGKATGDKSEQIRGKGEAIEGRIEEGVGKAKRKV